MCFKDAIENAKENLNIYKDSLDLILIAHVTEPRGNNNALQLNCSKTEHFTIQEFDEIYKGLVSADFFIKNIFFNELDFIKNIIFNSTEYSNIIVFNLCRNGRKMNNKTIIPAICDLLSIPFTSSSAGCCALSRNKLFYTSYLSANGIPCPISGNHADDLINCLSHDSLIICKPKDSSASQGITENNIIPFSNISQELSKDYFIQEYIDGYECEVPIFSSSGQCFAMPPVGILFNSGSNTGIVTEDDSIYNNYDFYNLSDILDINICKRIMADAEKVFNLMGLEKYGRIDFRIDKNTHRHYLMDISTTPYITKHSSFAFIVNKYGGDYSDIFRLIVNETFSREHFHKDKN